MKVVLKEKQKQLTRLNLGDLIILNLDCGETPFLIIGVNKGCGVSMLNLNTIQEGVRFRKDNLAELLDYIEGECYIGECEIVDIIRNQNVEIREV